MYQTPVLFIIFNRLRTTPKAFECIRRIQPQYLYIAADGPRADKPGEAQLCKQIRELVLSMIDWPCELKTLFRDENEGCGKGVSNAITWFFNEAEEGIVLEDDCIPDPSFFSFCEVLLDRYKDNPKIMHIGGNNFQFGQTRGDGDYYYSYFSHNWGWASWKRAWKHFQYDLDNQKKQIQKIYKTAYKNNKPFIWFLDNRFNEIKMPQNHIWDIQWHFAIIKNKGISIIPNKNLVQNIGFGEDGTHTLNEVEWNKNNKSKKLNSFQNPSLLQIDHQADELTMKLIFRVYDLHESSLSKMRDEKLNRRREKTLLLKKRIKSIIPNKVVGFLRNKNN